MTDIIQMSKGGTKFYPQTHAQAIVGLNSVGTNLITNSNFSSGLDGWAVNRGTNADCKAVVTTDSDGDTCIHITGTGMMCGLYRNTVSFNQNQVTTGSALAKGTGKLVIVGIEHRLNSTFGTISTDSYSKIGSIVQASSNTNSFTVYFNPVNSVIDVYIKFVKLEKGSIATDYSLNPLDIATDESVQTAITNALSNVKTGPKGADGKDAVINIISQADYDKLADKSGIYFIKG